MTTEELIYETNLMFDDWEVIKELMTKFAKFHVTEALKAAADNSRKMSSSYDTIIKSYDINDIK